MDFLNKCSCDKLVVIWQKIKLDPYLTPHLSINPRWIRSLKYIKGSKQELEEFLFHLSVEQVFLRLKIQLQQNQKTNKVSY